MKISIVFILIYVIATSWCQDETVFHCSPKPGCDIAQCDPVAVGWDRPGFNIDEHLHVKEFPITCKSKNTPQSQNTANLFPLVSRNILDIGTIKSELQQLEDNVDENRKNLDQFEKSVSDQKVNNENKKQSDEVRNLRDKSLQQSGQINDLRRKYAKQSVELYEVKIKNVEQSTEISDLKKAMSRIEQKLASMEKSQLLTNRSGQITKPTTKTQSTLKPTPAPEICRLKVGNICYFVVFKNVNYDEAVDICRKRNADVGLVRDKESYNAIVKYLRRNILEGEKRILIWTGIQFDPMTGDITPADLFIKWFPGDPGMGIDNKDRTNIYLAVNNPNTNDRYQGMVNNYPTWGRSGVICEILIQ